MNECKDIAIDKGGRDLTFFWSFFTGIGQNLQIASSTGAKSRLSYTGARRRSSLAGLNAETQRLFGGGGKGR